MSSVGLPVLKGLDVGLPSHLAVHKSGGRDRWSEPLADRPDDPVAAVWAALDEVLDPEIPINLLDLGLIYGIDIEGGQVSIRMTLTAPTCGMGPVLISDVKYRVAKVPNVENVDVELVFDPQWSRDMMTEEAQLEAGLFF